MKRQIRKSGKKLPLLWDESMDFEVAIRPLTAAETNASLDEKIIVLAFSNPAVKFPQAPPPMAA